MNDQLEILARSTEWEAILGFGIAFFIAFGIPLLCVIISDFIHWLRRTS